MSPADDPVPKPPRRRSDEHESFLQSVAQVDWLVLAVVGLYLAVDRTPLPQTGATVAAMAAFGAFVLLFRSRFFPLRATVARIAIGVAVTVAFITFVAAQSGATSSPLVNLFLLPIVLAAVVLGARGTVAAFGLVTVAWLSLLSLEVSGVSAGLPLFARVLGELGPFALVAYLTQRLSGSIMSARQRIAELAERDAHTGLLNLGSFTDMLGREHAARTGATGTGYAVLMIDMDRLKQLNDTLGHDAGNSALRNVAESIKRAIRTTDVAARYGGDEFVVFLPDANAQMAEAVAQRIRNTVYQSLFEASGRMHRVTVSVGAAMYPRDGRTAADVLAVADKRMYQDKNLRRRAGDAEAPARAP